MLISPSLPHLATALDDPSIYFLSVGLLRLFDVAVVLAGSLPDVVVVLLTLQIAVKQHDVQFVAVSIRVTTNHRSVVAVMIHCAIHQTQAVSSDGCFAAVSRRVFMNFRPHASAVD